MLGAHSFELEAWSMEILFLKGMFGARGLELEAWKILFLKEMLRARIFVPEA